ncbi:MAG: cellulase family glycosylhydrolase [Lachnospiraceae bacterium]|nr:cellulase family glycosylhydrolase [Lachnospiraceae bacterium]
MIKRRFSRLASLTAAAAISLTLFAGCGNSPEVLPDPGASVTQEAPAQTGDAQSAQTQEAAQETDPADAPSETPADSQPAEDALDPAADLLQGEVIIPEGYDKYEMRGLTPTELIAEMKTGFNMGNALDAFDGAGLSAETSWGNPKTTKEMVDAICAAGFNLIRIPVTFAGHMGPAPDYTVEEEWMDRVQEVVDYCLDDGMYVLLDSHHEESWRIPDEEHIDAVNAQNTALWTQIAQRFADYGDHLVFDGLNEPRVKGGVNEWSGGTAENRACLISMNQGFVDAVRATGGKNEQRLLLVTSYASSANIQCIGNITVPDDPYMGISIHAYAPYDFCYESESSVRKWTGGRNYELDTLFSQLKGNLVNKGIPVILTEYGAVNKQNNDEEVAKWVTYYLTCAKEAGIPCVWWDNGVSTGNGELFGIFNRRKLTWSRPAIVKAIMDVYD